MRSIAVGGLAALVLALGGAPGSRAQSEYGAYLEPVDGQVLQGIGQFLSANADYLEDLDDLSATEPVPWPATQLIFVNITPEDDPPGHAFVDADQLAAPLATMAAAGRIPVISVSFKGPPGAGYPDPVEYEVETACDYVLVGPSSGGKDNMEYRLSELGEAIAEFGKPVFVRLGVEINNVSTHHVTGGPIFIWHDDVEGYHPYIFPECYRRARELIEDAGAIRCSYIWCWQASAPTDYDDVDPTEGPKWYPGDEYVDWFGLDVFAVNEFTTNDSPINNAGSKLAAIEAFLDFADETDRPVFLAESSCVDFPILPSQAPSGPTDPSGSWDNWFEPFLGFVAAHESIKAITYISWDWNEGGGPDNWLDGTITNNDEVMGKWIDELLDPKFLQAGAGDDDGQLNGYDGWYFLDDALAGTHGDPLMLGIGPVVPGGSIELKLLNAKANANAYLVVGATETNASFKGGVLVPSVDTVIPNLSTGSGGTVSLPTTWQTGVSSGFTLYFQFWIPDSAGPQSFAASNGLAGVTL